MEISSDASVSHASHWGHRHLVANQRTRNPLLVARLSANRSVFDRYRLVVQRNLQRIAIALLHPVLHHVRLHLCVLITVYPFVNVKRLQSVLVVQTAVVTQRTSQLRWMNALLKIVVANVNGRRKDPLKIRRRRNVQRSGKKVTNRVRISETRKETETPWL